MSISLKSKVSLLLIAMFLIVSSVLTFLPKNADANGNDELLEDAYLEVMEKTTLIDDNKEKYFDYIVDGVKNEKIKVHNNLGSTSSFWTHSA